MNQRNVICCLTCAIIKGRAAATDEHVVWEVWDNSWDVCKPDEEMQAFEHAQANPQHIMVRALDYGFEVNQV